MKSEVIGDKVQVEVQVFSKVQYKVVNFATQARLKFKSCCPSLHLLYEAGIWDIWDIC